MGRKKNISQKKGRVTALEKALNKIYYDYGSEGALNNDPKQLERLIRREHPKIVIKPHAIENFLKKQPSYTVHRRIGRKQFKRRHIRTTASKVRMDADLIELGDLAHWNKGYRYILTVIDTFSKYLYAVPLKKKESHQVAEAFKNLLIKNPNFRTELLYTDSGTEFTGAPFQSVLKKYGIRHRLCTSTEWHCPFVERVNRTVKEKLFQSMTARFTREWLSILPKIVSTYNATPHSSTGLPPKDAAMDKNLLAVYNYTNRKYSYKNNKATRYKYKVGDLVRILRDGANRLGTKGYLPKFTWEIFRIRRRADVKPIDRLKNIPPAYILEDLKGEEIEHAIFYEGELSPIDSSLLHGPFPIREILAEKDNQIKVWWHGTPKSSAEWIRKSQLQKTI